MVSYVSTRRKYHGKMAETYEDKREKQQRWHRENEVVKRYLEDAKGPVLDVPVGTGRFILTYVQAGLHVTGLDVSSEMLALAQKKVPSRGAKVNLLLGDITNLPYDAVAYATGVCVRFLDLVPQDTMEQAIEELSRVVSSRLILTIRLGTAYVPKSNTATHEDKRFYAMVRRLGWEVAETTEVFDAGWNIMRLER